MCDPKTRLRGSLRATKCLDASYSVPRHHTITMGPYRGVPRAPWAWQNKKNPNSVFRGPVSGAPKKTPVPRTVKARKSAVHCELHKNIPLDAKNSVPKRGFSRLFCPLTLPLGEFRPETSCVCRASLGLCTIKVWATSICGEAELCSVAACCCLLAAAEFFSHPGPKKVL